MPTQPLVSVIIPAYNHRDFVDKAILSATQQTYGELEILVQDDCSQDGTWDVIQALAHKDYRIKATRTTQNMGGSSNHLDLVARAKGKYIALLSSDDIWMPEKTEHQVDLLETTQNCVGVFGQPEFIDSYGQPIEKEFRSPFWSELLSCKEIPKALFLRGNGLCHPASLIRREAFLAIPNLNRAKLFANLPDFAFWIGLAALGDLQMQARPVVQFRLHEEGTNASCATSSNKIRDRNEFSRALEGFLDYPEVLLQRLFPHDIELGLSQASRAIRLALYAARLRDRAHAAFALNTVYSIMQDPAQAVICQREIGFGAKDLQILVQWCDPLGVISAGV